MTRSPTAACRPGIPPLGRQHRPAAPPATNISLAGILAAIAHISSDQIYERLTGEKAISTAAVVFVDENGSKEPPRQAAAIMDQDGANVRYLTKGADLVLTPRFSRRPLGCPSSMFATDRRVYRSLRRLLGFACGRRRDRGVSTRSAPLVR